MIGEIEVDNLNSAMQVCRLRLLLLLDVNSHNVAVASQPVRNDSDVLEAWQGLHRTVRTDQRGLWSDTFSGTLECHSKLRSVK